MTPQIFENWLSSLSLNDRMRALSLIYSQFTIFPRKALSEEHTPEAQLRLLKKLSALNELHHTLANQLVGYSGNEQKAYPTDVFSNTLFEVAHKNGLNNVLVSAIEFARTRNWSSAQRS